MSEVVGDCRHDPPVRGCASCPVEYDYGSVDAGNPDVDEFVKRQGRIASIVGPVPTCEKHGRTPCDVCGESFQPMNAPTPASEDEPSPRHRRGTYTVHGQPTQYEERPIVTVTDAHEARNGR